MPDRPNDAFNNFDLVSLFFSLPEEGPATRHAKDVEGRRNSGASLRVDLKIGVDNFPSSSKADSSKHVSSPQHLIRRIEA